MKIIYRSDNKYKEVKYSKSLKFLYKTFVGRVILKLLVNQHISIIVGAFLNTRLSVFIKNHVIKKQKIDMSKYEDIDYNSYNKFFTRKYKSEYLKVENKNNLFISPCDSKLMILKINDKCVVDIKHSKYQIKEIITDDIINKYKNGYLLIFRLEVDDYHRYCFIDDGTRSEYKYIKGILHTVQPIAYDKYKVYHQNSREWCVLNTKNFDDVIQVEVGALLVGQIVNNKEILTFKKGEEKGYFEFGGSTILMFVKDQIVEFDQDIINNSMNGNETVVKYGERIGKKIGD